MDKTGQKDGRSGDYMLPQNSSGSMKNERVIQYKILCRINLIVLKNPMQFTKFQSNRTVSLGVKRLDISLLICEAATILVM